MVITNEEAKALYEWIKWQYLPYEDEILHKFVDKLSDFVRNHGLESRTDTPRDETR